MKGHIKNITIGLFLILSMAGCGKTDATDIEIPKTTEIAQTIESTQSTEITVPEETAPSSTTISGSFTVTVRDMIPDYCLDNVTPCVAVVSEFQSYPFTIFVGEELGRELEAQLETDEVYVFTIEPITVNYSKEDLEQLSLSSLVWDVPGFRITDVRPAEENELGLDSLQLTVTENE